ncbi:MAG: hypothetical protein ABI876_10950, partial [Bacteroidota bacterium]
NINVDSSLASRPVAVFNVDEFKQTGNPKENGVLYPDDTVIIPGDSINTLTQVLSIIGDVAVVAISIIGLVVAIRPK